MILFLTSSTKKAKRDLERCLKCGSFTSRVVAGRRIFLSYYNDTIVKIMGESRKPGKGGLREPVDPDQSKTHTYEVS